MIYLSRVELAFNVPGRGCVIVPVDFTNAELRVRAGDAIQLRRADECIKAIISSIEFIKKERSGSRLAFLLSTDIELAQVPANAEIWVECSREPTAKADLHHSG